MATRTIANGGGNWSSAGTWVEGIVPTNADDVVATATSGNVTIDTTTCVCSTMILTGYVGTMTFGTGNKLTVTTTVTFTSGMSIDGTGTLQLSNTATITSAGKIFTGSLIFDGGTWTLADNWTVSGNITATNNSNTLNGNTIYVGGSIDASVGSSSSFNTGTTLYVMNGTGMLVTNGASTSRVCRITINTTGTITFGTNVNYSGGVFTYTSGTVITTSSTLITYGQTSFNTNGMTFNNIVTQGGWLITLLSDLTCVKLSGTGGFIPNITGNYNVTCDELYMSGLANSATFNFAADKTLTVNSLIIIESNNNQLQPVAFTVKSATPSSHFHLNYLGPLANCKLFGVIFTDCDASGSSVPIFNWCGGTLTRTTNIYNVDGSNFPAVADVKSGVSYAGGAKTGTYSGGSANDVFGMM